MSNGITKNKDKDNARGRLFTRGKKERYYVQFYVNGKQIVRRLTDPDGKPITEERKAKKARDRLLAPYLAKDEVQRRRQAYDALKTAEEAVADAEKQAKSKTPIKEMWNRNPWITNTRGSTERQLSENTVKDNRSQWSKFVEWTAGHKVKYAEDVNADQAKEFRDHLVRKGLSGDRTNKVVMCCKVMFELSGIDPGPFEGLRKRHHKAQGRRELTANELSSVCQAATGELRTLLAVGLYTGLRLGDACRLEWSEIAPDLSRIIREPSKSAYKQDSELVIPVHVVLQTILSETPRAKRKGYVMPDMADTYTKSKPVVSKLITKHFADHGIRVHKAGTGVIDKKQKDGTVKRIHSGKRAVVEVGFHSLRHSFVSICARQGVPLHVVQSLCGHSSPQVQRLYLHNSIEDTQKAIDSLPSITGNGKEGEAATDQEREARSNLAEHAATLPIEHVQTLLAQAKELANG